MARFLASKLTQYALVLVVTLTLNFMLPRMMPGGPAQYLLGDETGAMTPEVRAALVAELGLDQPMAKQYVNYLGGLLRGDLGYSLVSGEPIRKIIGDRLPWTVLLAGLSLLLSTAAGVVLGTVSAWRRGEAMDIGLLVGTMFIACMPVFWLGMMLIVGLGMHLRWFPLFGLRTAWANYRGARDWLDVAWHLVLPVVTLALHSIYSSLMVMRYSMVSVLGDDFILLARAKGVPERQVMYRHAMRNALLPVATNFMLGLGFVVGGATVTETVFSFPGIGRLMYESVLNRDYPVLQATFLIVTVAVIVGNILSDLMYPLLDPRVRRVSGA